MNLTIGSLKFSEVDTLKSTAGGGLTDLMNSLYFEHKCMKLTREIDMVNDCL